MAAALTGLHSLCPPDRVCRKLGNTAFDRLEVSGILL
jgi:hypothetical protein